MEILNGAIVEYQGQWQTGFTLDAVDIRNRVTAALSKDGLSVRGYSDDAGFLGSSIFGLTIEAGHAYNVSMTLQVENGLGFGNENDIISIVRHEVFQATDRFPSADSIPTVRQPTTPTGAGAAQAHPVATGQPSLKEAPSTSKPSKPSLLDSLKNLGSNTELVVVGLGLGLIVAILLIASPRGQMLIARRK